MPYCVKAWLSQFIKFCRETKRDDGCTTMRMYLILPNWTLSDGYNDKLYVYFNTVENNINK